MFNVSFSTKELVEALRAIMAGGSLLKDPGLILLKAEGIDCHMICSGTSAFFSRELKESDVKEEGMLSVDIQKFLRVLANAPEEISIKENDKSFSVSWEGPTSSRIRLPKDVLNFYTPDFSSFKGNYTIPIGIAQLSIKKLAFASEDEADRPTRAASEGISLQQEDTIFSVSAYNQYFMARYSEEVAVKATFTTVLSEDVLKVLAALPESTFQMSFQAGQVKFQDSSTLFVAPTIDATPQDLSGVIASIGKVKTTLSIDKKARKGFCAAIKKANVITDNQFSNISLCMKDNTVSLYKTSTATNTEILTTFSTGISYAGDDIDLRFDGRLVSEMIQTSNQNPIEITFHEVPLGKMATKNYTYVFSTEVQ